MVATALKVTNAGDGLSKALKVDPVLLHHGDRVYVVLECDVTLVQYTPVDAEEPEGDLVRSHTLKAGAATIIDGDSVRAVIDAQKARIKAAEDEERGQTTVDSQIADAEKGADEAGDGPHE